MKLPSNTSESSGTDGWIFEAYKWERNKRGKVFFRMLHFCHTNIFQIISSYLLKISVCSLFRQLTHILWASSMY